MTWGFYSKNAPFFAFEISVNEKTKNESHRQIKKNSENLTDTLMVR